MKVNRRQEVYYKRGEEKSQQSKVKSGVFAKPAAGLHAEDKGGVS